MTIEKLLTRAVVALETIAENYHPQQKMDLPPQTAPVATPAPQRVPEPTPTLVTNPAPQPVPKPSQTAPFTDNQGLINWVIEKYKELGPEKGASIQMLLQQMGYANINDVKPEHYVQFYTAVENM